MRVTIRGIQEAQRANERVIANLKPAGAFGRAIQYATIQAHRHTTTITHVDTGALRASHRMRIDGLRGQIFIDPASPGITRRRGRRVSGRVRPSVYGVYEHNRGGKHAFYKRTTEEAGGSIARAAGQGFIGGLP